MPTRRSFARLDVLFGSARGDAGGRSRRALHVERLEDRRMMNVDNPLVSGLAEGNVVHHAASYLDAERAAAAPSYSDPGTPWTSAVEAAPAIAMASDAVFTARGDDARPSVDDLFDASEGPSRASKHKVGRAAAIAQLARAWSFGEVKVPRRSPLALDVLRAIEDGASGVGANSSLP